LFLKKTLLYAYLSSSVEDAYFAKIMEEFKMAWSLDNILLTLLSMVIPSLLLYIVHLFRELIPTRRFWRIKGDKILIVASWANEGKCDSKELSQTTYKPEMVGTANVFSMIERVYKTSPDISLSTPNNKDLQGDIVVIGGPITNLVAGQIFEMDHIPFYFGESDRRSLTNKKTGKIFKPKKDSSNAFVAEDYAIVLNTTNPFDENHRAIIISGCMGIGTECACKLASNLQQTGKAQRKIKRFVKRNPKKSFYFILKIESVFGSYGNPVVVDMGTFNFKMEG